MRENLRIAVLGKLQIHLNGEPVTDFASMKAQALLAYLAMHDHPISRAGLAGLLWGEMPEESARANLRLVLNKLKPFAAFLTISRGEIGLDRAAGVWVDADGFSRAAEQAETVDLTHLQDHLRLYRGDFLYDFAVRDAPDFELWLVEMRERFRMAALRGFLVAARRAGEAGAYREGVQAARQVVALDPYNEDAHRLLMLMLVQTGQRAAALQQYEICLAVISEELGIQPAPETVQLYERIRAGEIGSQAQLYPPLPSLSANDEATPARLCVIPKPATPFVGRSQETALIRRLLETSAYRLLVLVGLGGVGKTRLALAAGQHYADSRPDRGVVFVSLAGRAESDHLSEVAATDLLATTIAEALGLACPITHNLQEETLACLARQNLLLILDNFEELQGATAWVRRILDVAPHVTLLITSRVRLGLPGEQVIQVGGLVAAEAVALFRESVERLQPDPSAVEDTDSIARICQLVEGFPLAIELAAQWIRTIPTTTIASRLSQNLDLLQAATPDFPERQRNIRTIFDYTWRLLGSAEQEAFARLSVFRKDFSLEAAEHISDAPLPVLNVLIDHSLLRQQAGRYRLHELLRQIGIEQLRQAPHLDVHDRMAAFYAAFLQSRSWVFTDEIAHEAEQTETLAQIDLEADNLRAALEWLLAHGRMVEIMPFMEVMWAYFQRKGWYSEAVTWLGRVAARADQEAIGPADPEAFSLWRVWVAQRIGIANYEMGFTAKSLGYFQQALGWLGFPLPKNEQGWGWLALRQTARQVWHRLRRVVPATVQGNPPLSQRRADEAATGFYYLARIYFLSNTLLPYLVSTIVCVNLAEAAYSTTNLSGYYGALALLMGGIGLHRIADTYTKLARKILPTNRTWRSQASALEEFGLYSFLRGRWAEAQTMLLDAAHLYKKSNLIRYAGEIWALAVNACGYLAKTEESRQIFDHYLEITRRLSDPRALIWEPMMVCSGALRLNSHPLKEVLHTLTTFEADHHADLSAQDTIRLHAMLATTYLRMEQPHRAEQYMMSGLELSFRNHNLTMYLTSGLGSLIETCLALWEATPERTHLAALAKRGGKQFRRFVRNFPGSQAQYYLCQGGIEWLSGNSQQAIRKWQRGLHIAEAMMMPYEQARLCIELGRHSTVPAQAEGYLKRAGELCLAYGFTYELGVIRALRTTHQQNQGKRRPLPSRQE